MRIIFLLLLLTSCGMGVRKGEGSYTGTLVDVEWVGLLWESCEIRQQTGMGTDHEDRCSSLNKELCSKLRSHMGEVVTIDYSQRAFSGPGFSTNCLIESFKLTKIEEYKDEEDE